MLALTSPTSDFRGVSIVRSRNKAMEFSSFFFFFWLSNEDYQTISDHTLLESVLHHPTLRFLIPDSLYSHSYRYL
jgi:hypothetical protein